MKKRSTGTFKLFLIAILLLPACVQAVASTEEPGITPAAPAFLPTTKSTLLAPLQSLPSLNYLPLTKTIPNPLPATGVLNPGTYFMDKIPSVAFYERIIFTLPGGWATSNGLVYKNLDQPGEVAFSAWIVDQVYADPCHWQESTMMPLDITTHTHDSSGAIILLAPENGGLAHQALRGSLPRPLTTVTLGGQPALRIDLSVPDNLDISTCDKGEYRSWTGRSVIDGANSHNAPGQLDTVYMVDIDRRPLVIDVSRMPAASEVDQAELEAILASMIIDQGSPFETPPPTRRIYIPDVAPTIGNLDPGTYTIGNFEEAGFNLRFTVPAGWTWNGRYLSKGGIDQPAGAAILFFSGPVQVYADPCYWNKPQSNPSKDFSIVKFINTLSAQPLRKVTEPVNRPANSSGATNIWSGKAVELTVPADINFTACDEGQYRSWGPESSARIHQAPGQLDLVWAVELALAGEEIIIDAAFFPGTPADVMSEIKSILESIVVGHWG